jgi:alpha-D-ribose 1-methylphosphonate 5-triphosphate synthase subunit PhnG
MTNASTNTSNAPRQRWLAVLARADRPALEQAAAALGELPPLEHVRLPSPAW